MNKSGYNPALHDRRSIRMKGHDYAGGGLYFVTLCVKNRQHLFGQMKNGKVCLSEAGHAVEACWQAIPEHFPGVQPKELAVMPDHVHGIIRMPVRAAEVRAKNLSPIPQQRSPIPSVPGERPRGTSRTLGSVIRGFKVGATQWIRENTNEQDVWHRNYYERIVRDPDAEKKIVEYIRMNPWRCVQDFGNGLRGMGNPALWSREKLGVLCSRNAPKPKRIPVATVYLSGFHSPMEQAVFEKLLELRRTLIWCPAWGLGGALAPAVLQALEENRMLILEMRNTEGNLAAAEERNRLVLESADRLWLPHVQPGGMLERLLRETGKRAEGDL